MIEVKSSAEPVNDTATSDQISKYWDRYKLVLVTNLCDWLLIGERGGQRVTLERFTLAADEASSGHWPRIRPRRKPRREKRLPLL